MFEVAVAEFLVAYPPLHGPAWISALEAACRAVSLVVAAAIVAERQADRTVAAPGLESLLQACDDLLGLARSPGSSRNNHALGERCARALLLWVCGARTPTVVVAINEACEEFLTQTNPDGSGKEAATRYWRFNLEWGLLLQALSALVSTRHHAFEGRLARARQVLQLLEDVVPGFILGDTDDATVWMDGWAHRTFPGPRPDRAAEDTSLRDAARLLDVGLGVAQVGQDPDVGLAFRAGPFGYPLPAPHSHADQLSIFVSIDGAPLITDPGSDRYFGATARSALRLEEAHATFTVGNRRQACPGGRFLWLHHDRVRSRLERLPDPEGPGFRGWLGLQGAEQERVVRWEREGRRVLVVDKVQAPGGEEARWVWPLGPHVRLGDVGDRAAELGLGSRRVILRILEPSGVRLRSRTSVVSEGYGTTVPALVLTCQVAAPCAVTWELEWQ